jgi:deoxyribose-phosphate aldolase
VKASGGIRTAQQARALVAAGASRLGASSSVGLITRS